MKKVLVGIIMGSDSDLPIMKEAKEVLDSFGVPNEIKIRSAHRTTKKMVDYAAGAKKRGIEVIIAGAGGAAHLPGMVASLTPLIACSTRNVVNVTMSPRWSRPPWTSVTVPMNIRPEEDAISSSASGRTCASSSGATKIAIKMYSASAIKKRAG